MAAKAKGSAIDERTKRHAGYAISQRIRKRIEEAFGWGKTVGPVAKTMPRGLDRVGGQFTLTLAAYNLARLPRLLAAWKKTRKAACATTKLPSKRSFPKVATGFGI